MGNMTHRQAIDHFERGIEYFRGGFFSAALVEFRQVERLDPRYPNIGYMLEVARKRAEEVNGRLTSDLEEAFDPEIQKLADSLKIAESTTLGRDIERLLRADRPQEALEKLEAAAFHVPESLPLLLLTASVYRRLNRLDDAERTLLRALILDPGNLDVMNVLGNVFLARNHFQEAREQFEEVLRLQPDDRRARNNLGSLYMQTFHLDEAHRLFSRLVQEHPAWGVARRNLRNLEARMAELDREIERLRHEAELHPTYPDISLKLGKFLLFRGYFTEARHLLERTLEKNPGLTEAWFYLGNLHEQESRIDEAVEAYRELVRRKQREGSGAYKSFQTLWDQGFKEEALFELKKMAVLDYDPGSGFVRLGMRYFEDGLWKEALRRFQEAAEVAGYPDAHYWMGLTRLQLGKKKEAAEDFQRAIEHNPRFADAHFQLGMLMRKTSQKKARHHLQAAVTLGVRPQFSALAEEFLGSGKSTR